MVHGSSGMLKEQGGRSQEHVLFVLTTDSVRNHVKELKWLVMMMSLDFCGISLNRIFADAEIIVNTFFEKI